MICNTRQPDRRAYVEFDGPSTFSTLNRAHSVANWRQMIRTVDGIRWGIEKCHQKRGARLNTKYRLFDLLGFLCQGPYVLRNLKTNELLKCLLTQLLMTNDAWTQDMSALISVTIFPSKITLSDEFSMDIPTGSGSGSFPDLKSGRRSSWRRIRDLWSPILQLRMVDTQSRFSLKFQTI